ncbi:hypothetical protein GGR50DRAFT_700807 [Xylaria sp. CBS 124048]|nr:hypothetical protein GGR50DRAFT_700807 [Xylaria sp. CBS 124048]
MCPAITVAHFMKAWNREHNYTGKLYDVLEDKFRFFLDTCYTLGIRQSQFHAVFSLTLSGRAALYFIHEIPRQWTFTDMYLALDCHFNTEQNKNAGKTDLEVLQLLLDKLSLCQRALRQEYCGEHQLISTVHRACRNVPQLQHALFEPSYRFEDLASKLRTSIGTHENLKGARQFLMANDDDSDYRPSQFYVDRHYHRSDKGGIRTKNNGTPKPHRKLRKDETEATIPPSWLILKHRINPTITEELKPSDAIFMLDHDSQVVFQGVMPDTGAARFSTAGKRQYEALLKEFPDFVTPLDLSRAAEANIRFGNGSPIESLGSVRVNTAFGSVDFHVMDTDTPFFLCLKDMDRLGVYLNNVSNQLVSRSGITVPVTRKWGHPWFSLSSTAHFTEAELRCLHTRLGHPSVPKLHDLLSKAGHEDVDPAMLKTITKLCHHCQIKGKAPQRFRFSLKDPDINFNYEILADVMYIDGSPVLHVVDAATGFQAARFMRNTSAKETWELLKACWIDTYLSPADVITHDSGTNFNSTEFRNEARLVGTTCNQVPVEAHWSVGKIERYHAPIHRDYEIFSEEIKGSKASCLQMAVKAVNDTANPDGLATQRAMAEVKKIKAQRNFQDALNTRNGPNILDRLPASLPLGSQVLVYRENKGWTGPHKVVAVSDKTVTVEASGSGTSTFANSHVKL